MFLSSQFTFEHRHSFFCFFWFPWLYDFDWFPLSLFLPVSSLTSFCLRARKRLFQNHFADR